MIKVPLSQIMAGQQAYFLEAEVLMITKQAFPLPLG